MELSVNIDHIATLREARKENFPDPIYAAVLAELGGANGITVHLRMDERHIKERDLRLLKQVIKTELNLEMAVTSRMMKIALEVKPDRVSLVPEQPGEITTQGGLNLLQRRQTIQAAIKRLKKERIKVSIFIDPDPEQIRMAKKLGADMIEINTARYSIIKDKSRETVKVAQMARVAKKLGLIVHAGHGIDYQNIIPLLRIPEITGFSIGFSIVARSVFVGLTQAVREMREIIDKYRC